MLQKKLAIDGGPGYRLIRHPRFRNKPLTCQSGLHGSSNLVTVVMHGIPSLMCKKCGEFIFQGLYGNTWSKKDMAKAAALAEPEQKRPRTREEIMKEIWERNQGKRKERMQASIAKFVAERMELVE